MFAVTFVHLSRELNIRTMKLTLTSFVSAEGAVRTVFDPVREANEARVGAERGERLEE